MAQASSVKLRTIPPLTAPIITLNKKSRGFSLSLGLLSLGSFAGAGGMYYLYRKDHWKEEESLARLNSLKIKGSSATDIISQNKTQHQEAQTKLIVSEILTVVGAASLATNVVFYF